MTHSRLHLSLYLLPTKVRIPKFCYALLIFACPSVQRLEGNQVARLPKRVVRNLCCSPLEAAEGVYNITINYSTAAYF